MTGLVDTHAHLCDAAFESDLPEVLARAQEAGVGRVIAVAENLAETVRTLEIAQRFPDMVLPAVGLFPTILDLREAESVIDWIRRHREQLIAIGEVGLDHWKVQDTGGRQRQREIFTGFVDLSLELDLPLNVHSRAAGRPTIELLLERQATRVQLHAFDGRAAKARPGVEAGYLFSIPPSIVRSPQKQKLVRQVPLHNLLLETDSPVLGPRGDERNEPANVTISLAAIAEIKQLPLEQVRSAVVANTRRLYGQRVEA